MNENSPITQHIEDNASIIVIKDTQTLNDYANEIVDFLNDEIVKSNPYHFPGFIHSIVSFDKTVIEWNVLLVYVDARLSAIIPLYVCDTTYPLIFALFTLFKFNIRQLKLFGNAISYSSDCELSVIHEILKQHLESNLPFDLGLIDALPADNPMMSDFQGSVKGDYAVRSLSKKNEVVRYIGFPASWDDYFSSMKRKRRYNLNRNLKILKQKCDDDVVLHSFESVDEIEPFLQQMDEIYKQTWQSAAFGSRSRLTEIEIQQNIALAKLGVFKSYVLQASQTPIAFIRGYLFRGKYYYEEIGYKPEWSNFNPGSVLNLLMLQHLMDSEPPVKELNFGYGENVYKQVFSNGEYEATNAFLYRLGSKGHYIFLLQRGLNAFYNFLRSIIVKLKLEVVIRRLLRKKFW